MALTEGRPYDVKGHTEMEKGTATAAVFKGGIVTISGGNVAPAANTAGLGKLAGVAVKNAAIGETVEVERGRIWIPRATAALADVGQYFYATADDTIATTATNADPCGICVDVKVGVANCIDFRGGLPKTAMA